MKAKDRGWITTLAILSISLIICSGNAVTPALPSMIKAFPSIPTSIVDMIGTVQQFAVIFALFISVILAHKIGIKKTISLGLVFVGIAGIIPAFCNNFAIIMLSRLILGIGVGFFNSLAIDIINIYYQNNKAKRIKTIGARTAFEPLGVCILTMLAGWLVTINWHLAFLVYLAAFPVLLFFYRYVPEVAATSTTHQKRRNWQDVLNPSTIVLTLMMVFMCIVTAAVTVQVPNIVAQKHLGSSEMASLTISLNTLMSMVMGFGFGLVFKKLHRFTLPFGMVFMALGSFIVAGSASIITLMIGAVIIGCAFPLSGSYIYAWIGDAIPKRAQALITSILLVGCNLGTFISPIVTGILSRIGSSASSIDHAFTILGLVAVVIGIGITVVQFEHLIKQRRLVK